MNQYIQPILKNRLLLILIFPFFYFFAGLYIKLILDDPSLRSIDPDYAYFISGLNIAEGIFKLTHIDHPGAPLQYLIALVIRIIHLFRSNPDLAKDVLGNPDLYLTAVNITITLTVALSLFIAGRYVYKKTNSVIYALLVQTVPFVTYIWYEIIGRITPELLMPLPIVALCAFLIVYISGEKESLDKKHLIILSIILAFGLSLKLTLVPLLVIPLIVVKSWKSKASVLALTLVFFLLLALPATLQIDRFWNWAKGLFMHSGNYGTGEENIVDLALLKTNLGRILMLQKSFTYLVALLMLLLTVSVIWFRKKPHNSVSKIVRVTFAVVLLILAQAVIVGKHYSPHYFIPAVMFTPLLVFLTVKLIKAFYPSRITNLLLMSSIVIYLVWITKQQIHTIGPTSGAFQNQIEARKQTRRIISTFEKESIKIIVSQDYGSPFVEYALHFSTVWSAASARERYRQILGELYPNTYQYTTWDGNFIQWGEPLNSQKISDENIPVYFYLEKNSEELFQKAIEKAFPNADQSNINASNIFTNEVNGEVLIRVDIKNS